MKKNNSYIGIDYGRGLTNIDLKTGIRYGVISINSVSQFFLEDFDPVYPEPINDGADAEIENDFDHLYDAEPVSYEYKSADLICEYSAGSSFIFVLKSPVIVRACFCSPCVPGAGDLDNLHADGVQCYGLPADCLAGADD